MVKEYISSDTWRKYWGDDAESVMSWIEENC